MGRSPGELVCVRCGTWYPKGTRRCARDKTPLVRPETVTELVEEATSEVETICAACGERYPPNTRRCPRDGTPLVMPDTLVELLNEARAQPNRTARLTCVRCGAVYPPGTKRCAKDGTPLVVRSISPVAAPLAHQPTTDDLTPNPIARQPTTDDGGDDPFLRLKDAAGGDATPTLELLPTDPDGEALPTTFPTGQAALLPTGEEDTLEPAPLPSIADKAARLLQSAVQRRRLPLLVAGLVVLIACVIVVILVATIGSGDYGPTSVIMAPDDPPGRMGE